MRFPGVAAILLCSAMCGAQTKPTEVMKKAEMPVVDAAHAATPEQIREYFAVTHLDSVMKRAMSQMVAAMKLSSPPYMPAAVWDDMDTSMEKYDFLSELVPIYQKHLSRDDMAAVLTFYRSEAGQHLLANQNVMTNEAQASFQAIGERLGEQVGERHSSEIAAAKKKYEDDIANRQNLNLTPDPK